jgi:hypothetical protein
MEKLEPIYQVFYQNSFEKDKVLSSDTFNAIFSNKYEMYFLKYIEKLQNAEEVWEYENEIYDYQNEIVLNSKDLAYNLNFVIVSKEIDLKTRRILEQDKFTSKKVIILLDNVEEDIQLLSFMKRKFLPSIINEDLDKLLLEKLRKIDEAEYIVNLLSNSEIVERDIDNLLALMRGDKVK